jgi:hypothetical protein
LFEFKVNGVVADHVITGWELQQDGHNNQMQHFEVLVDTVAGANANTLTLHDLSSSTNIGFAVDNIQIHDWVV